MRDCSKKKLPRRVTRIPEREMHGGVNPRRRERRECKFMCRYSAFRVSRTSETDSMHAVHQREREEKEQRASRGPVFAGGVQGQRQRRRRRCRRTVAAAAVAAAATTPTESPEERAHWRLLIPISLKR